MLEAERPDAVIVPGDVNSTLAAALACAHMQIPVAHLEAGLRSFDRTMPEEVNRVLVDQVSDAAADALAGGAAATSSARGSTPSRVELVGNTMIDTLVALEDRFRARGAAAGARARAGLLPARHAAPAGARRRRAARSRRSTALSAVAEQMPVVFPVHPRTRARLEAAGGAGGLPPGLRLIEPVGYLDFLSLQADARAVLTDSGGIQEETTYLGVPCFTLRDNTERPITVEAGTNTLLGLDPARIAELPALLAGAAPAPRRAAAALGRPRGAARGRRDRLAARLNPAACRDIAAARRCPSPVSAILPLRWRVSALHPGTASSSTCCARRARTRCARRSC